MPIVDAIVYSGWTGTPPPRLNDIINKYAPRRLQSSDTTTFKAIYTTETGVFSKEVDIINIRLIFD